VKLSAAQRCVGETPTRATGTVALPGKSPLNGVQIRFLAIPLILALATVFCGCKEGPVSRPTSPADKPASGPVAGRAEKNCLDCHGPFDKLIEVTAKYVAPTGEKTSPHRYVPHDSKLEKDIPDCTHCHTAHPLSPLPAKASIDLSKVSVEWCYTCHHEKNFESCKNCHP
jgi:hypothetical protein